MPFQTVPEAKPTGKDFSRVKPSVISLQAPRHSAVRCLVAGHAACRMPLRQIAALRSTPLVLKTEPLPASFFKHADEQTVAGFAALAQANQVAELADCDYTDWGVVAAPRFLGRAALAVALTRFAAEGAWGISPHLIPHRSLHALSGTVSQALKIHGPNFGVGGGPDGAAEALLAAGALLADQQLPGVWVLLTGFDPELVPTDPADASIAQPATECVAVALALMPPTDRDRGVFLTIDAADAENDGTSDWPTFSLENLAATLCAGPTEASWQLGCGGWAIWDDSGAAVEMCQ
jgi:hypothetical protein